MQDAAELELREFLSQKLGPEEFLKRVEKRIKDNSLPWEERRFYWYYLYNTGCYQEVWHLLEQQLLEKNRIPFDLLMTIAAQASLKPSEATLESLQKGLKKQSAFADLLPCQAFDKWDERLTEMRKQYQAKQVDDQRAYKQSLVEKFEFLNNERMTEQAVQVLNQLRKLYPTDPQFIQFEQKFKELRAREVIASMPAPQPLEMEEIKDVVLSEADAEMIRMFLTETERLANSHPKLPFDMAIAFWFLEQFTAGLEVIKFAEGNESLDWLVAELLLATRRYVECLDYLSLIEQNYSGNPETTFAVSYLRAQAYKRLGQKDKALEILRSIVHVRPGYRSAQRLLSEWSEGSG